MEQAYRRTAKNVNARIGSLVRNYNAGKKMKSAVWILFRTLLLFGLCFIILYPLAVKVLVALKHKDDIFDRTIFLIPKHFTLENFKFAWQQMQYVHSFLDSIVITVPTSLLQMASCALAAYGFTRLKFFGSNVLFGFVIFSIIVPPQTIMIPSYLNYRFFDLFGLMKLFTASGSVNLLESNWPFYISSITASALKNGLYIYIFRQFFRSMPKELEEAGFVDGAGTFQTFLRIIVPNTMPAFMIVFLFSFVWQWGDTYYVNLYYTVPFGLASQLKAMSGIGFWDQLVYRDMLMNGGVVLFIAPILLLYLFVQRYFVESVERSGLVG